MMSYNYYMYICTLNFNHHPRKIVADELADLDKEVGKQLIPARADGYSAESIGSSAQNQ
jgi:hypothetical protein